MLASYSSALLSRFFCGKYAESTDLVVHIYKAYSFIDVVDGKEISNDYGEDWKNIVEAAVVIKILTKLFRARVNSGGKLSIAVISPYKAQVQLIQEMSSERIESNSEISPWVRSSEEIQNCEVDIRLQLFFLLFKDGVGYCCIRMVEGEGQVCAFWGLLGYHGCHQG
ncbi:hypothetical protein IFM89_035802 [Coptis chinensis]|uniref:DNA2/NAM7 helicase-like C-terminal domain-containing protein n=1 Tax=Coptis chinensis TaxID=261450 RepID=A0A835I8T2_9MAGN|nr:hypothetical protein IFM89_035802 [Coptis chinensis]